MACRRHELGMCGALALLCLLACYSAHARGTRYDVKEFEVFRWNY